MPPGYERLPEPYRTGVCLRIEWVRRHRPEYFREVVELFRRRLVTEGDFPDAAHYFFRLDCLAGEKDQGIFNHG